MINNYKNKNRPDKNELIIHLRVGDVIEDSEYSVDQHLNDYLDFKLSDRSHNYVKPIKYYEPNK